MVVGGTSGLGLELAKKYTKAGNKVIITGRHDPKIDQIDFIKLDLSKEPLASKIKTLIMGHYLHMWRVDVLIYAAGYYQEGTITDLSEKEIEEMINVCARGLVYFTKYLLEKQGKLNELITITSTSQWTPRKLEPIYNFAKSAAGHFTNALAEDGRIKKVMVVGPSGMKTDFWRTINHPEWDKFLEPSWVVKQITDAQKDNYRYKYIRILRDPGRVEEVEKR